MFAPFLPRIFAFNLGYLSLIIIISHVVSFMTAVIFGRIATKLTSIHIRFELFI